MVCMTWKKATSSISFQRYCQSKFYARKMSSVFCSNVIKNIAMFCEIFFDALVEDYGSVIENIGVEVRVDFNIESEQ